MTLVSVAIVEKQRVPGTWVNDYSGRFRHPIPIDSDTLFRSIAAPHSGAFRHPQDGVIEATLDN